MRELGLMDMGDIIHIPEDIKKLKECLVSPHVNVYTDKGCRSVLYYFRVNEHCLEAHVEGTLRGHKLKRLCIDSGKDAVSKDDKILSVLNFVDKERGELLLFSGTFAKRVGEVNNKILFVTERERYL